jgi:hypothetical protein
MKILFFLAVWRRPEITEICFMGLNRMKRSGLFPMNFLAVISENSMKPLCKKYGIDYVVHENLPLGKKKNFGLTEAFKKNWDYLIELGSDDVLKTELLEIYKPYIESNQAMMCINTFCYLNSEDMDCRIINTSVSYGMGRAIERSVLERVARGVEIEAMDDLICPGRSVHKGEVGFFRKKDAYVMERVGQARVISDEKYKLWNDSLNKGLDNNSNFFLARNGVMGRQIKSVDPLAIDIKSKENLWPFNKDAGTKYDLTSALKGLSEQETQAILSL